MTDLPMTPDMNNSATILAKAPAPIGRKFTPAQLRDLRSTSLLLPQIGEQVFDQQPKMENPRLAVYGRRSFKTDTNVNLSRTRDQLESDVVAMGGVYDPATDYFFDDDISAKGGKFRPGIEALLQAIKAGRYDGVLVWEYCRWTRNRRENRITTDLMRQAGCEIYSHTERWLTLFGPIGFLVEWAADQAAKESERISARITDWHAFTARAGHHKVRPPFGMIEVDHPSPWPDRDAPIQLLAPDEEPRTTLGGHSPAFLIRAAATAVLEGSSIRSVASEWNTAGYPSPNGTIWSGRTLGSLLRNPQLAGYALHQGQIVTDTQGANISPHEPLLDPGTYALLAAERTVRALAPRAKTDTDLRGMLRCSRCGATLLLNGKGPGSIFYCGARHRGGSGACQGVGISRTRAEAAVWAVVLAVLADPARLSHALTAAGDTTQTNLADVEGRLILLRDQVERLEAMELAGEFDDRDGATRHKRHHDRLTAQLDQVILEQQRLLARRPAQAVGWLDPALAVEDAVVALSDTKRRQLLRELLDHIVVGPAKSRGCRFDPSRLTYTWRAAA